MIRDPGTTITNALSFDVEDYFHVHAFRDVIDLREWDRWPMRVVDSTRRVLRLLERTQTRATFFVLGWVAERAPELVQEIHAAGHELASHGHLHQPVYELGREGFREDLRRASDAIRSAVPDAALLGYRAPSFSINEQTPWAFEELKSAGFEYDSSLSPASLHDRYGVRDSPRFAHRRDEGLLEIPPSTVRVAGQTLQVVGGGHFRLAPARVSDWAVRRINAEGSPVVTYFHPWEFDPEQPRVVGASTKSRLRHYTNLRKTESRLERLLQRFPFDRVDAAFEPQLAAAC
ncbi:XrtA system polysaccharide deacetylase [Botrimarina sp.]|uniref:XrtA system polysaccharide deacetylase n=1 Tax=Botrimarina sp. TaxID=2795802 RepID=UPI0032EFFE23